MKSVQINIRTDRPPTIEINPEAGAAYIRFKPSAKVARTVEQNTMVMVDLDSRGEVIGVEIIGINEFSAHMMIERIGPVAENIDWHRARFTTTRRGSPDLAAA